MFVDIVNIFSKFRGVYAEVIKWVRDITLNQYYPNIKVFEKIMGTY
jgi:hypothetical protein